MQSLNKCCALFIFYLLRWLSIPTELFILIAFAESLNCYLKRIFFSACLLFTYQKLACLNYEQVESSIVRKTDPVLFSWRTESECSQFCICLLCQESSYLFGVWWTLSWDGTWMFNDPLKFIITCLTTKQNCSEIIHI